MTFKECKIFDMEFSKHGLKNSNFTVVCSSFYFYFCHNQGLKVEPHTCWQAFSVIQFQCLAVIVVSLSVIIITTNIYFLELNNVLDWGERCGVKLGA